MTLYLDNTDRFAWKMVRGVEQECEEEDEASVPERKNKKRMHKEKRVWGNTCLFRERKFYKDFRLAVDYGVHSQYWWD